MPSPAVPNLIHHRDQTRRTTELIGELPKVSSLRDIRSLQHSSQWLHSFLRKVKLEFSSEPFCVTFPTGATIIVACTLSSPIHRVALNIFFLGALLARRYTVSGMGTTQRNQKPSVLETVLYLQGYFRQQLLPIRISPMQAAILLHLEQHPDCHLVELASAFHLQPESMGANVSVVLRRGWAHKIRTNENRRIVQLSLTANGKTLLKRVKQTLRSARVKSPSLKLRPAA